METSIKVTLTCRAKSRRLRDAKDIFDVFEKEVEEKTKEYPGVFHEKLDIRRSLVNISLREKDKAEESGVYVIERLGECVIQIEELPIFVTFNSVEDAQDFASKFSDSKYTTAIKIEIDYFTDRGPV